MENKFMRLAIKQAEVAMAKGEIPVGAVIVYNNEVIALAHNQKESTKNAAAHAEILAIKEAGKHLGRWQLDGCEIYVTLQPCPMCKGAICEAHIKTVYFGAYDKDFDFVMDGAEVYGGIMEEECSKLIVGFFGGIR